MRRSRSRYNKKEDKINDYPFGNDQFAMEHPADANKLFGDIEFEGIPIIGTIHEDERLNNKNNELS